MCFSEKQSYINSIMLLMGSMYVYPKYKLSILLIFLALKDLIQGLLYHYQGNEKMEHILTVLSWVHICFQPLMVNIAFSYFSKNNYTYWYIIYAICFIYAIYTLTTLKKFDIQNDPNCSVENIESIASFIQGRDNKNTNDFCSKETTSYMGKYHIAYQFKRDNDVLFFPIMYGILMFIPCLFTNARLLGILWGVFVGIIYIVFRNIGEGEKAAIWCFLSIIFLLPVCIFNKYVSKILLYWNKIF